jgi:hypothetical protein
VPQDVVYKLTDAHHARLAAEPEPKPEPEPREEQQTPPLADRPEPAPDPAQAERPPMTDLTRDLVAAVKKHAAEHYEEDGWDYLVESYEDHEVAELIGGAKTERGAIRKVAATMRLLDERRRDIQSTAF